MIYKIHNTNNSNKAFTIAELAVVIAVIGILAGLVAVSYGTWRSRIGSDELRSTLLSASSAMNQSKNFSDSYPTTLPGSIVVSSNVALEMANQPGGYCINAYNKVTGTAMSIRSSNDTTPVSGLCSGAPNGSVLGGPVPAPPRGTNLAPEFDGWTLTGTTTYNASTKELSLGANGTAASPLIRVNGTSGVTINGLYHATTQSAQASFQPNGGWHVGSQYFQANATTAQANTTGHTGNGCARTVSLNTWSSSLNGSCTFATGNGIVYLRLVLYSAASGYSSSNLRIKDLTVVLN